MTSQSILFGQKLGVPTWETKTFRCGYNVYNENLSTNFFFSFVLIDNTMAQFYQKQIKYLRTIGAQICTKDDTNESLHSDFNVYQESLEDSEQRNIGVQVFTLVRKEIPRPQLETDDNEAEAEQSFLPLPNLLQRKNVGNRSGKKKNVQRKRTLKKPAEPKKKPLELKKKPLELKKKPVESRKKPVESRKKPVESRKKPVEPRSKLPQNPEYFTCLFCQERIKTIHAFTEHVILKHAKRKKSYVCRTCGLCCYTRGTLVAHGNLSCAKTFDSSSSQEEGHGKEDCTNTSKSTQPRTKE